MALKKLFFETSRGKIYTLDPLKGSRAFGGSRAGSCLPPPPPQKILSPYAYGDSHCQRPHNSNWQLHVKKLNKIPNLPVDTSHSLLDFSNAYNNAQF